MGAPHVGIVGGSGLYAIDGLEGAREVHVETPYGAPSDAVIQGTLGGCAVSFLPRHGRAHRLSPSEIPYLANIWALRSLGCDRVLSISAVGSMREDLPPGALVIVDQFIDRTVGRPRTFFSDGCVAHVSMADPTCPKLGALVARAAEAAGVSVSRGGCYVCIEGPQFSTRAESALFRSWGVDVIGMTNLPEARLAREAQLPYATLALVTDYDCWREEEAAVSVEAVVAVLTQNTEKAKRVIVHLAKLSAGPDASLEGSPAHGALHHAVMTRHDALTASVRARLGLLLDVPDGDANAKEPE